MIIAVNGTLMRGLSLNHVMINSGAKFIEEAKTSPVYRLWSIKDNYPGMMRVPENGKSILLELWQISKEGLIDILKNEPPGLTLGKILLFDNRTVLGILAESYIITGCTDITSWGGWRPYINKIT